jgi:hypothetical protein
VVGARPARAGKHVLCEKPFSRDPKEVEHAFDIAEAEGRILMEALCTATIRRRLAPGAASATVRWAACG